MTARDGNHDQVHAHTHGAVDPALLGTERGLWAVQWSFAGLMATALLQVVILVFAASVALLADTIHNFADASTAIPLWIAFRLSRRDPSDRFTYGYGRMEDLAGLIVVLMILASAAAAGYESIARLSDPREVRNVWALVLAAVVGFLGNEAVARFRIKVGGEIGSAALVADGYHARTDGLTSLGILVGAVGIWLGFPLADPLVGLAITVMILRIAWETGRSVLQRLLDGVDPQVVDEIRHAVGDVPKVQDISEVRVRWLGHRMHAEVNVAVDPGLTVAEGHTVAAEVRHQLHHHLQYLSGVTVHIDPLGASGEEYHRIDDHTHGDLPPHSH